MALVGVEDLGSGMAGESAVRPHRPDPADPEQHLLQQPVLAAAAVEPVGHPALAEVVLLDVRVEHQERDTADLGEPDAGVQLLAAGQGEGDLSGRAVRFLQEGDGQLVGVEHRVVLLLPAVPGQGLAEVAVPIQEAYADQGYAEITGRLQMVADEDAEAAGVLRQGGRDTELGREVGDGGGQFTGMGLVPALAGHIVAQVVRDSRQTAQESGVLGQLREPRGRHAPQEPYGIAVRGGPALGVDGLEEVAGLRMPGPAQVAGQVTERPEGFGENGSDGESTDRLHFPPRRVSLCGRTTLCASSSPSTVSVRRAPQPRHVQERHTLVHSPENSATFTHPPWPTWPIPPL